MRLLGLYAVAYLAISVFSGPLHWESLPAYGIPLGIMLLAGLTLAPDLAKSVDAIRDWAGFLVLALAVLAVTGIVSSPPLLVVWPVAYVLALVLKFAVEYVRTEKLAFMPRAA